MATTIEQDQQVAPKDDGGNVNVVAVLRSLTLPEGFGFRPTDAEIITQYLMKKVYGQNEGDGLIHEVDNIYDYNPEDLPSKYSTMTTGMNPKWYFYTAGDKNYSGRSRYERVTTKGYWIPTAAPRTFIIQNNKSVGLKKKFNFYSGWQPQVKKTNWSMFRYSLPEMEFKDAPQLKDLAVLFEETESDALASAGTSSNVPEQTEQPAGPVVDSDTSESSEGIKVVGPSSTRQRILGRNETSSNEPQSED